MTERDALARLPGPGEPFAVVRCDDAAERLALRIAVRDGLAIGGFHTTLPRDHKATALAATFTGRLTAAGAARLEAMDAGDG